MARPRKQGLEYFPHDVHMVDDAKVQTMLAVYGLAGLGFYCVLLGQAYQYDDGCLALSLDLQIAGIARMMGIDIETFRKMLATALEVGLFDKYIYTTTGLVTSNAIKARLKVVNSMRASERDRKSKPAPTDNRDIPAVFPAENPIIPLDNSGNTLDITGDMGVDTNDDAVETEAQKEEKTKDKYKDKYKVKQNPENLLFSDGKPSQPSKADLATIAKQAKDDGMKRYAELWVVYPTRPGCTKKGGSKVEAAFLSLTAEDQSQCLAAAREYAKEKSWPVDLIRFLKSQKYPEGLWRNYIPQGDVLDDGAPKKTVLSVQDKIKAKQAAIKKEGTQS